jgi:hypothetical protein
MNGFKVAIKYSESSFTVSEGLINDFTLWDASSIQHAYEHNTTPYNIVYARFGLTYKVGVTPYVKNELLATIKSKLEKDGSYLEIPTPSFFPGAVTYYIHNNNCSQSSLLVWVWLTDGRQYFYKKNDQVYFVSSTSDTYAAINLFYDATYYFDFYAILIEISEEMRNNTNITFPVGGAIKIYNSTDNTCRIYLCSIPTANMTKHPGDFSIFLSWTLYHRPVFTDDKRLRRDLKANNAIAYYII